MLMMITGKAVTIRLGHQQWEQVQAGAEAAGCNTSQFIRECVAMRLLVDESRSDERVAARLDYLASSVGKLAQLDALAKTI